MRAGEQVVVSTDACFEGVHFRLRNESPRTVGRRALAASLSDLAAMGARPLGCLLALAAPPGLAVRTVDLLVAGLLDEAGALRLSAGRRQPEPRARALAHAHRGRGGGAGPRPAARRRPAGRPHLRHRHARRGRPRAGPRRARAGPRAAGAGPAAARGRALAALGPAGRPASTSRTGSTPTSRTCSRAGRWRAEIDAARLPVPPGFRAACARAGLDPEALARGGGEDYELLFTLAPGAPSAQRLSRRLGVRVTEIGRVVRRPAAGRSPRPRGWRHF